MRVVASLAFPLSHWLVHRDRLVIVLQVMARKAQLLTRKDVLELMSFRILKIMAGVAGVAVVGGTTFAEEARF